MEKGGEGVPLPAHFDRQGLAEDMAHAALNVFVDSDHHGLMASDS